MTEPQLETVVIQSSSLLEFRASGGVVDYAAFQFGHAPEREALHRHAAVEGLKAILGNPTAEPVRPGDPKTVSLEEFVGPYFDWHRLRLVDPWDPTNDGGFRSSHGDFITAGYADAFLDPPYKLSVSVERASILFNKINALLFGGLTTQLDIRKWPTDWSNYFDDGKEWWGAFCWTVYVPNLSRVCVVAASSTD